MMRALVLIIAMTVIASPARADDKKRAATHLKQGAAYYKTEQYDAAIAEFEAAYKLDAKPQTLFNIGNAYYKKGDLAKAIESFQRYLAADPDGKLAPQALEFSAIAKKELAEQEAKKRAQVEADRVAAEAKRVATEQEQTRIAIAARIKQAEAFENTGAWGSAGDEYMQLAATVGSPEHYLLAAEAYRKQPALDRAQEAYRAYLGKVPMGGRSDHARAQLAIVTTEIEKQRSPVTPPTVELTPPPRPPAVKSDDTDKRRWWLVGLGGVAILAGVGTDLGPESAKNGRLDPLDFAPLGLYGVGTAAVLGGLIRW